MAWFRSIYILFCLLLQSIILLAQNQNNPSSDSVQTHKNNLDSFNAALIQAFQGDLEAECYIGSCYSSGLGVHKNEKIATKWFERAALEGYAAAQNVTGSRYLLGLGVPRNIYIAASWFKKAANQGDPQAMLNFGNLLINGGGVKRDQYLGLSYIAASESEQGYPILANAFNSGNGVPKDVRQAWRYSHGINVSQITPEIKALISEIESQLSSNDKQALSTDILWNAFQKGQPQPFLKITDGSTTIPLISKKLIIVAAIVNGRKANLLIDTTKAISLIDSNFTDKNKTSCFGTFHIPQPKLEPLVTDNTIQIGSVIFNNAVLAACSDVFPKISEGIRIDGVIGNDLLKQYLITFDFSRDAMKLDSFLKVSPPSRADFIDFNLSGGEIVFNTLINGVSSPFMLDSTSIATFVCEGSIKDSNALILPLYHLRNVLINGIDSAQIPLYLVDDLKAGDSVINHVVVQGSPGDIGQFGLDLLRCFDQVTIDFQHRRIFFNQKKDGANYSYPYSGLNIETKLPDLNIFTVQSIDQLSPASACGIQEGDRIDVVDGKSTANMTYLEVFSALNSEGTHLLELVRNGQKIETRLLSYDICKDPYRVMEAKLKDGYFRIKDISVSGHLISLKAEEIIKASSLKRGDLVSKRDLSTSVKRLLSSDVVFGAGIYVTGPSNSIKVTITIGESPIISAVSIIGLPDNEVRQLLNEISTETGTHFCNFYINQDMHTIQNAAVDINHNLGIQSRSDSNNHVFFELK